MILAQLIQAGRRFCECRSRDFIPRSEEQLVLVAYTIADRLLARSLNDDDDAAFAEIREWLHKNRAIAYLLITRQAKSAQKELPSPVGRAPMDSLTLTAFTNDDSETASFLIETHAQAGGCRLIRAAPRGKRSRLHEENLLAAADTQPETEAEAPADEQEILLSL